jgi:diacylglycerol O-acyltransferase / wax synthase
MARTRMTTADVAWLHMDRPTNLMVVNSVMWFDELVDWDRLREVYEERVLTPYPRFRQRVVESRLPFGLPSWEDDPDFDIDHHLIRAQLDPPGDRTTLHRYVSEQLHRPLDRDRPLWEAHLIDGYEGGAAIYTRIHHCVADGIALARLMMSMTDGRPEGDLFEPPVAPLPDGPQLGGRVRATVSSAVRTSARVVREGAGMVTQPSRAVRLAELATAGSRALARDLLLPPDHRTVLKGRMGPHKHALWSAPIALADVKAIGRAHGATVNDVLCTAVTGALRTYLEHRDSLADDVRALVPFNLRPLDEPLPRDLGNRFGVVALSLPVGTADRQERLAEVRRRMDRIKSSPEGVVIFGLISVTGMTPVQVEKYLVDFLLSKGSLVLTNVPGPTSPVYLAGSKVAGVMAWVPASGGVALGISIMSYDGKVTVGVSADARLVPDPEVLMEAFDHEVAELLREGANLERGSERPGADRPPS